VSILAPEAIIEGNLSQEYCLDAAVLGMLWMGGCMLTLHYVLILQRFGTFISLLKHIHRRADMLAILVAVARNHLQSFVA
jgi:hypothetical protein